MKKLLSAVLFLLVALIFATSVNAAYTFSKVEVNGVEMSVDPLVTSPVVRVERGETITIRTELFNTVDADDVKVRAWIGGYEYGNVEYVSGLFDLDPNVTDVKYLTLKVPNDIDASKDYTLHVQVFDTRADSELEYTLRIARSRHELNFVDVIFNPGLTVRNDQPLFVTVRVENLGDKKEEDVRVIVAVPELGISQRTFMSDLRAVDPDDDSKEDNSQSTESLFLDLSDARAGNYNAVVRVEYNRGHDFIEKVFPLTISAGKTTVKAENFIVDVTEKSKDVNAGQSTPYRISFANLGSETKKLTLEVVGVESWGTARADPISLSVEADSSKEAFVFISPKENAENGNKMFSVRVKDGETVLKEIQLQANVVGGKSAETSSLKSGLEVGFVVLLIVLVILGIILAINKLRSKEEPEQSYY